MANTNLSKVERLGMKLRIGVATRLMDRVGYETIREWLRTEGVAEEALPSDRSMNGYRESMEYGCLEQQQVDRCLGMGDGEQGEDAGECVVVMPSPEIVASTVLRRLELRLRVSDEVMTEYRAAASKADGFEDQLLEDLRQQWLDEQPIFPPASTSGAESDTDGEKGTDRYQVVMAGLDRSTRTLLEGAAGMPGADCEEVQLAAFWMRRRARLARDPRMLKPGVFLRMIAQLQASVKQLSAARTAATEATEARERTAAGIGATERAKTGASAAADMRAVAGASRPVAGTSRVALPPAAASRPAASVATQTPTVRATPPRTPAATVASAMARPVEFRADSAGFGRPMGVAAEASGHATSASPAARPGVAKAVATPTSTPSRATSATGVPRATATAQPAGLCADSAGFRRPAQERKFDALESMCRKATE